MSAHRVNEIAAATPYSAIEEAGWRTFATAPKDGSVFLVAWFRENKGLFHVGPELVKWWDDATGWVELPYSPFERDEYAKGGWRNLPTHWAPVPAMPGAPE